ncbi:all-trans-retinol dehydrogenase (NAD+) [Natronospira proteinivora]|uniref:All-trans-retinol dehydrogenase (NAD+) n=1 Tax=Natronospira proteinivora TaxID=1807133 RepID=A0ABT1G5B2_9GAMM|nr:SDR family oxidoreductase [Natronospira proteinivora]MCP1726501.1 all-trans-retinol dehydrogenase (NAD+) [Natronospira proteinivora]
MTAINNSLVLVTGAASGIGRGLCREMGQRGARVIGVDRDEVGLNKLAAEMSGEFHPRVCDLSDVAAIEALAAWVEDTLGPVDILINNAGVVNGTWLDETEGQAIETTFRINALAPIHLTRCLLPGMLAQDRGHVVTVASAAGIVGTARLVDYSASKAAAVGFDDALRMELKHRGSRVRTTIICPFFIDTGMFEGVQTRWPWLLPILKPDVVIRRTLKTIEKSRTRLIMPWLVYTAWPARLLPLAWFDRLMRFLGVSQTMDAFTGRKPRE